MMAGSMKRGALKTAANEWKKAKVGTEEAKNQRGPKERARVVRSVSGTLHSDGTVSIAIASIAMNVETFTRLMKIFDS
jgi:hypothetical protein